MLMFWKEKLVILQVPKTGTTALCAALGPRASMLINDPPQMRHLTYRRYAYRFAPFFENFDATPMQVVAVLRNPVDWVASWYRFYHMQNFDGTACSTKNINFDAFLDELHAQSPAPYAQIGTQSAMIEPPAQPCQHPLRLFAYENMDGFLAYLNNRFDDKISLKRINQSPRGNFDITAAQERKIMQLFEQDMHAWRALR